MAILHELVEQLDGNEPICNCSSNVNGHYACVKVHVVGFEDSSARIEVIGYSHGAYSTEFEAIDRAAEDLICSLKKKLKFEIDDVNWVSMKQYDQDRAFLYARVEDLEKKVILQNFLVDSLVDGWAHSLKLADLVYNMAHITYLSLCTCFGIIGFGEDANQAVIATMKLKKFARFALVEGTNAMRRAVSGEI